MNSTQEADDFLYAMNVAGYVVCENVLPAPILEEIRHSLSSLPEDAKYKNIVWSLFDKLSPACVGSLIENKVVLPLIDAILGDTCIIFSFNAVPLQPGIKGTMADYHRDSGRYIPHYDYAFNVFYAITDFTSVTGGTLLVPGSHRVEGKPSVDYIRQHGVQIEAPAGSAIILNSNVWHASGQNNGDNVRWGVNITYVKSFMRQQFDFPRALDASLVEDFTERGKQLLGFYVRMPSSLTEYALPESERLYRAGQG
jgi:ectoine hydroxylase-related dioxygenase (phytanoyl-CoA dioxygenase family)